MKLFFNILLIFLLLIAFVPVFRRFIFHLLVGRQLVKEQKRANRSNQKYSRNGTINIDPNPQKQPPSSSKGGEYIDYEEIKE